MAVEQLYDTLWGRLSLSDWEADQIRSMGFPAVLVGPGNPPPPTFDPIRTVNNKVPSVGGNLTLGAGDIGAAGQAALDTLTTGAGRLSDTSLKAAFVPLPMQRRLIAIGSVVDDLSDPGAWSMTSGTGSVAVANNQLTITTTGSATVTAKRDMFMSMTGRFLSFDVQRDANLSTLDVNLAVAGNSSAQAWRVNEVVTKINTGEWYRYTLPVAQLAAVGTVTLDQLADVRALRFVVKPNASTDTTVLIKNIRLHDDPQPPSVHFTFDDGRADTYSAAYPILKAAGYAGGIAVEHTAVGNADRCSLAQLQQMYADGWSMYGHHVAQITDLTDAQAVQVFADSKTFLQGSGFRRGADHWVWPGGARDAAKEAIAARYWRTMRKVGAHHWFAAPYVFERKDPAHVYLQTSVTLASAKAKIDSVAAAGSGAVVFVNHSLVNSTAAPEDWLISDYQALVDYAKTKGLVDTNLDKLCGGLGSSGFA